MLKPTTEEVTLFRTEVQEVKNLDDITFEQALVQQAISRVDGEEEH